MLAGCQIWWWTMKIKHEESLLGNYMNHSPLTPLSHFRQIISIRFSVFFPQPSHFIFATSLLSSPFSLYSFSFPFSDPFLNSRFFCLLLCWRELWLKVERLLGSGFSTVVTLTWSHDHVSLSGCVTHLDWYVIGRLSSLADSLPDAMADRTSLLNQAHMQYHVEKPGKTPTITRLACHLVGAPSRSGGHEFEPQMHGNSVHWLKVERLLVSGHSTPSSFYLTFIPERRQCLLETYVTPVSSTIISFFYSFCLCCGGYFLLPYNE